MHTKTKLIKKHARAHTHTRTVMHKSTRHLLGREKEREGGKERDREKEREGRKHKEGEKVKERHTD